MSTIELEKPMTLAEMAGSIRHRHLDLSATTDEHDPNRPCLSTWVAADDAPVLVTVTLSATWGQPVRYVDMSPAEARHLARQLNAAADDADRITAEAART